MSNMLYLLLLCKFFIVQWYYPCPGDWILQVRKDLDDLELPDNLETLKLFSKAKFKKLVTDKASKYTFIWLINKKETYRKLVNLQYCEFKVQDYLLNSNLSHEEKKMTFLMRTRISKFYENFKSGKIQTDCPICQKHTDKSGLTFAVFCH